MVYYHCINNDNNTLSFIADTTPSQQSIWHDFNSLILSKTSWVAGVVSWSSSSLLTSSKKASILGHKSSRVQGRTIRLHFLFDRMWPSGYCCFTSMCIILSMGAQNAKTIDTTYVSTIYAKTHTSRRSLVMQYGVPLIPSDNWVSGFLYHKYKQEHMQKPSSPII